MPPQEQAAPDFIPAEPQVSAAPDFIPAAPEPTTSAHPGIEMSPFPVDSWLTEEMNQQMLQPEEQAKSRDNFTTAGYALAKPWMDVGYSAAAGFNRGMAHFSVTLDLVKNMISRLEPETMRRSYLFRPTGHDTLLEDAAKEYEANAEWWQGLISKEGAGGVGKLLNFVSGATGEAVPGTAEFLMDVASNFTIPYAAGTEAGYQRGEHGVDPIIGGLVEAGKTGALAYLFRAVAPFKRYLQAAVLGTMFGAESATEAPSGKRLEAFGKGAAMGGLLTLTSPGGEYGLRDIYPEIGPRLTLAEAKPREQAAVEPSPDPDLAELTDVLKTIPRDTSFDDRISLADTVTKKYTGALGRIQNAVAGMKTSSEAAWDWYKRGPQWTTFDDMFGKFLAARQKNGIRTARFAKEILDSFPDQEQRALTNYLQAGGNEGLLRERADKTSDPDLKQGYEDALRLPDESKAFAKTVRAYWERKLDEAIDAGILDHGVENYVMQVWKKDPDNPVAQRLLSEVNSGKLRKNPAFAKKRIFDSYFEGEQAGKIPKDKRLGFLVASYQQAFDQAIATRQFVTKLSHGVASDGRPFVVTKGVGHRVAEGEEPVEAYVINPNATGPIYAKGPGGKRLVDPETGEPVEIYTGDYRTIDHPALRNHKWATQAETEPFAGGAPIFVQGDVKVHPEIYDRLNNYLGRSAIRDWQAGRIALRGSAEVKGTLLGFFSPFHQVHLAQTAATHWVNPLKDVLPAKIDLDDPLTSALIAHNLKVYDSDGMAAFSEGAETAGLERFIPFVGKYSEGYQEYLFGADGFIPRLKIHFAKVAYERNVARYPELSRNQVLKLSADQANAAFGGQNYEFMGRNKTFQDMLRLGALAPNFLESRIRSAGQALMPYGREQLTALAIRGAAGMYVAARLVEGIAHMIDPDNNDIHWNHPFSATIDGKEYMLRSEQGDIYHLFADPRSFAYYRLSPALAKPAIEALTGRDMFGRKKDATAQLKDWATSAVPIAGQGFFRKQDYSLWQGILQSMGVGSFDARTEAEKMVIEIQSEKSKEVLDPATQERMRLRGKLGKEFEKTGDLEPIRKAAEEGKLTMKDVPAIMERAVKGDVARGVTGFSIPDALKVWDKANDEEKAAIQMGIIRKWYAWQATMDEKDPYRGKMEEVLVWKPTKSPKRKFSILTP